MKWPLVLSALANDRRHGSTELLRRFTALCRKMAAEGASAEEFRHAAHRLATAHASMALLWNLYLRFEDLSGSTARDFVHAASEFYQLVESHVREAARIGASAIPNGSTLLLHSSSSQVRLLLQEAKTLGKRLHLFCTLSEPGREGVRLAQWAHSAGFPVVLLAESQLSAVISEVHLLLIGSDALCYDGVVHKVGTALLAYILWLEHRPLWAVSCGEKLLQRRWSPEMAGTAPPLTSRPLTQIRVLYDCTPWEHVAFVVTEQGLQSASDFRARVFAQAPTP
ncbi:MAG: hypothetical protein NZ960_03140 [Candidatus Kapabacteria bacterium]|nr:hypothetical protein [Candidatus Kapabacteria bacterium]MDW8012345.1 hypothetical protein [Bacteroidota bacterium]